MAIHGSSRGFRRRRGTPLPEIIILASGLGIVLDALPLRAAATLSSAAPANGKLMLSWDSRGTLELADQISGPWAPVTDASNPYAASITSGARFFRLNQTVDSVTLHKKVLCGYQG